MSENRKMWTSSRQEFGPWKSDCVNHVFIARTWRWSEGVTLTLSAAERDSYSPARLTSASACRLIRGENTAAAPW